LSVVIAFPAAFTDERALAHAIQRVATGTMGVRLEYNCIICEEARDVVELASQLSTMLGVGSVAIANKVSSNFSDLTAAIVEVGSKVIDPGERFYVKVVIQPVAKCEYVSRDIEFAASSTLAGRLASIRALPAKTEKDASRLILTVIGKKSAYVCIQLMNAPGGLIAGSQGRVLSSIHDSLSFLSCLTAAKAGFDCTSIVLPYVDKSTALCRKNRKKKTNNLGNANQCACKRHSINITEGKNHFKDSNAMSKQQDSFSSHCRGSSNLVHRIYHSRNCVCRKDASCAITISVR
jgi:adenylyl- and sulfurtransferase ThiI